MTVRIELPAHFGAERTALDFTSWDDAIEIGEHLIRVARREKAMAAQGAAPFRVTRPASWRHLDPDDVRDEINNGDRMPPLGWVGDAS